MASSFDPEPKESQSKMSQGIILSTTNAAYGMDLRAIQRNRTSPATTAAATTGRQKRGQATPSQPTSTPRFPFLFQRSSDEIGTGIVPPASSRAATAAAAAAPSLHQTIDDDNDETPQQHKTDKEDDTTDGGHGSVTHIHAEKYLQAYHHQTKAETPLYRTSQNVIGARRPTFATIVTERRAIPQAFSNSFGNILYSDQSLNTTLSRSKVHRALDPHFY